MIPLIKLRENLRFARELQDMIEVLKSATASQFRSFQQRRKGFEDYKISLDDFMGALDVRGLRHPFLRERSSLPKAVLMVTSDDGFVGGLNSSVISSGLEQASDIDELIVVGERGARYLSEIQAREFTVLPGIGDDITYTRAVAVRDLLIGRFMSKKIGSVLVSYPRFLSLTVQRVDVARVLPCADIFGKTDDPKKKRVTGDEMIIEPSPAKVIDYLARAWLMQRIYDIFWESKLSECAARIIHLEGSHEEIMQSNRRLMHDYFKHIHEKSDKNIREIFASRLKWRIEGSNG
ncbi:MAG: FoF1 ATP synthase subunit gamma [Candidatus Omnitrophota bacterium]|jgi:ATP synthase F1 gamma subunit